MFRLIKNQLTLLYFFKYFASFLYNYILFLIFLIKLFYAFRNLYNIINPISHSPSTYSILHQYNPVLYLQFSNCALTLTINKTISIYDPWNQGVVLKSDIIINSIKLKKIEENNNKIIDENKLEILNDNIHKNNSINLQLNDENKCDSCFRTYIWYFFIFICNYKYIST